MLRMFILPSSRFPYASLTICSHRGQRFVLAMQGAPWASPLSQHLPVHVTLARAEGPGQQARLGHGIRHRAPSLQVASRARAFELGGRSSPHSALCILERRAPPPGIRPARPAGLAGAMPADAAAAAEDAAAAGAAGGSSASKPAVAASEEVEEEEDEFDRLQRLAREKQRARRKYRNKKLQYQFLFKAGAFIIMLTIVLITKKVQAWMGHGKDKEGAKAAPSPPGPEPPLFPVPESTLPEKGEL
ncbi:unnamed protein product [Prorocentrum cordatum]|uniref:Uncharacterized protein n=1 Tax=Prorocentrum cordatum TaxID=2364126 RepID=A0ABN9URS0_9DINO|nr:unnamed protein product [Polarella glacialis]